VSIGRCELQETAEAVESLAIEEGVLGVAEIETTRAPQEAGQAVALEGIADVAAGAKKSGRAETLNATAGALAQRAE
jgi:hypothetical protein